MYKQPLLATLCVFTQMCSNDGVHLANRCSMSASSGHSAELFYRTKNTSLGVVIALLWNRGALFTAVTHSPLQTAFFSLLSRSTNGRGRTLSCLRSLCRTPSSDHSSNTLCQSALCPCDHIHFLLIMSPSCRWLLPDIALGLLISEHIINNLHVISFVLIIFVWRNVSLHGECMGLFTPI